MLQLSVAGLFLKHSMFMHIFIILEEKAENFAFLSRQNDLNWRKINITNFTLK